MRRSRVRFPEAAPIPAQRPLPIMEEALLLTALLTVGFLVGTWPGLRGLDGLAEDVGRGGLGGADHVGVHAEGDRRVRVAQAGRDDVHRHA